LQFKPKDSKLAYCSGKESWDAIDLEAIDWVIQKLKDTVSRNIILFNSDWILNNNN
jgi:hypothetical protein